MRYQDRLKCTMLLLLLLAFLQGSDSKYGYGTKKNTRSSGYGSSTKGYGSSSGGGYGSSTKGYGSSSGQTTSGSYGGTSGSSYGGSYSSGYSSKRSRPSRKMPLYLGVFLMVFLSATGMIYTAYSFIHDSDGIFANCCRVTVSFCDCLRIVFTSLYKCELSNIPHLIFSFEGEDDEDDGKSEMKLRPGIERALEVEHRKAMDRVDLEMQGIKLDKNAPKKQQKFDSKSMKRMKVKVRK